MDDEDLKDLIGFDPDMTDAELEKQLKEVDDGEDPMATLKELGILDENEGENDPSEAAKQNKPTNQNQQKEKHQGGSKRTSSSVDATPLASTTAATTTTTTSAEDPSSTVNQKQKQKQREPATAAVEPAAATAAATNGVKDEPTGAPVPETREQILAKMEELKRMLAQKTTATTKTDVKQVPPPAAAAGAVTEEEDKKTKQGQPPKVKEEKKSTLTTKSSTSSTRNKSASKSKQSKKAPASRRKRKRAIKVIVVGNSKCGKTSIINRYVKDVFSNEYKYTIGCDYSMKEVSVTPDVQVRLQLWDIAGQDRFIKLSRAFYKKSAGAILVCDVTRSATLEAVRSWKKEIDRDLIAEAKEKGIKIPVIMIANKVDLLPNITAGMQVGANVQALAEELELDGWFMGSAKLNDKIDDAMMFLLKKIVGLDTEAPKKEKDVKDFNSKSQFLKGSSPEKHKKTSSKSSSKSSSKKNTPPKSKKILKLGRRGSLGKGKGDKECTLL
mmetsp:Transcript_8018/g.15750  ORF Transcript_8018/g.15750 Transcript_8018/m.15750 type:complete len:498 (-) Transcript_8018:186-1679(-)|eukprot:CAMPEP_0170169966 /NCGR_PEP_ID=MMETSP0040_2-20121228/2916_1 /TAXON_ID=641309 /ORGANISM="Lotharella oceanica, Strain CCMP622" /LENGTH=497 /DNA_ID=CAMNT_0010409037 /DNA_START=51 /DNA_END=1544 /DNA_ORIENTATION=-